MLNGDEPESVYEEDGFVSRFYLNPLFRAEKIPGRNMKAGFTITHKKTNETLIFPSISSLIYDSYPEFTGGNPSLDHGKCEFSSCDFADKVQPVLHIDFLVESPTSMVKTKHKPLCTDCYVDVRSVVENHLSEQSEILATYLSKNL